MANSRTLTRDETRALNDWLKTGELRQAEAMASSIGAEVTTDAELPGFLSSIALKAGQAEKSFAYAQAAVELAPDNARHQRRLMNVAYRLGSVDVAEQSALAILKTSPEDGPALRRLAEIADRRGDAAAAENWAGRLGALADATLPDIAFAVQICLKHKGFRSARHLLNLASQQYGTPEDQESVPEAAAKKPRAAAAKDAKRKEASFKRTRKAPLQAASA
jgi:tetratricopeptide (TPR) repeat protein